MLAPANRAGKNTPVTDPQLPPQGLSEAQLALPPLRPAQLSHPDSAPRPRLLVIDDRPQGLDELLRMVSGPYEVTLACGGEQAFDLLRRDDDFDLVLCDMNMPGVDGTQVHEAVRQMYPHLEHRFIFWGDEGLSEDALIYLDLVDAPYFSRPVDPSVLVCSMARLLQQQARAHQRRAIAA